jgi:CRP-like cAMP-binding protein
MTHDNPLLARLSAYLEGPERDILVRLTQQTRMVDARHDIAQENARETVVRVLMKGMACRYKMMPCGRRAITAFILPGDFCDLAVLTSGRTSAAVVSATNCQLAEIPLAAMSELMERPGMMRALFHTAVAERMVLREWLAHMGQELSEKRVARLLCELRVRLEAAGLSHDGELNLPFTQEELGEALGISTVHVNRVLQRLRIDGLIRLHGRTVIIPDVAELEIFADFEPDYLKPSMAPLPAL